MITKAGQTEIVGGTANARERGGTVVRDWNIECKAEILPYKEKTKARTSEAS